MRANRLRQIMQDPELAHAAGPIACKHRLSIEQTAVLLHKSGVARAENLAQIAVSNWPSIAS